MEACGTPVWIIAEAISAAPKRGRLRQGDSYGGQVIEDAPPQILTRKRDALLKRERDVEQRHAVRVASHSLIPSVIRRQPHLLTKISLLIFDSPKRQKRRVSLTPSEEIFARDGHAKFC